ncbi:MAG: hypothetical protein AABW79_00510 [Nanoarchaeota archaeon]
MLKRGISGVVIFTIFILVLAMGFGVFWFGIKPIISSLNNNIGVVEEEEDVLESNIVCANVSFQINSCFTNYIDNISYVNVRRVDFGGAIGGVRLVFNTPEGIKTYSSNVAPNYSASIVYRIEDEAISRASNVDISVVIGVSACSLIGSPVICSGDVVEERVVNETEGICSDDIDNDSDGLIDWPADSGCVSADDEDENEDKSKGEIYALMWSNPNSEERPYLSKIYSSYNSANSADSIANEAKSILDEQPEGHRAMIIFNLAIDWLKLTGNSTDGYPICPTQWGVANCIWWDNGATNTKIIVDDFLSKYKSKGGELDFLIVDIESGFSNWHIGSGFSDEAQKAKWKTISDDVNGLGIAQIKSDIGFTDLTSVHNWQSGNNYKIWNLVNEKRKRDYINKAFYEPLENNFEGAKFGNYESANNFDVIVSGSGDVPLIDINSHGTVTISAPGLGSGDIFHAGNRQGPNLYGWLGQITWSGRGPDGINYPNSAFNSFRYSVNQMRATVLNDDDKVTPWIARRSFPGDSGGPQIGMVNSDFWQESVLHSALAGADDFIFWAPQNPNPAGLDSDQEKLSGTLAEFNTIAGFSDKRSLLDNDGTGDYYGSGKPWKELAPWGEDFVLTGMLSGGRKVWRFAPEVSLSGSSCSNVDCTNIANNQVSCKSATKNIIFEQARVYTPASSVSSCGKWIVQASDAREPSAN